MHYGKYATYRQKRNKPVCFLDLHDLAGNHYSLTYNHVTHYLNGGESFRLSTNPMQEFQNVCVILGCRKLIPSCKHPNHLFIHSYRDTIHFYRYKDYKKTSFSHTTVANICCLMLNRYLRHMTSNAVISMVTNLH